MLRLLLVLLAFTALVAAQSFPANVTMIIEGWGYVRIL